MHRHGFFIDLINKLLPTRTYMCVATYNVSGSPQFFNSSYSIDYFGCDIKCLIDSVELNIKKDNNESKDLDIFLISVTRISKKELRKLTEIFKEKDRLNRLKELKPNET